MKQFAPDYPRTEEGWIDFGSDTKLRSQLFPYTEASEHNAKANMHQVEELIFYVSEVEETICDPFAGTGTVMIGAMNRRKIIMLELNPTFCQTIELNQIGIKKTAPPQLIDDYTTVIEGNAASILPIPDLCNHMIFSPPYPQGLKKKGAMDQTSLDLGYVQTAEYSEGMDNFTNMNDFIYHQKIEQFYKKCFQSIRAGGTMTVIIKDKMDKGKRVMQADRTLRDCERIGFTLLDRFKRLARGGGYAAINRSAGLDTVMDEDMLILRRP